MAKFKEDAYDLINNPWKAALILLIGLGGKSIVSDITKLSELWDKIIIKFKGKKLAVFGERAVGKTHLIKFLTTGSLPAEYKQTLGSEKTSSRRFSLGELNLNIKATLDVSGSEDAYGEWRKLHDEADIVLYLLRADRLIAGDHRVEDRVRKDIQHISRWLEDRSLRPDFFIIGTHCDLDPEFQSTSPQTVGSYCDKFCGLQIVKDLVKRAGGTQQAKVVLGAMNTFEGTESLVCKIFAGVAL